MFQMYFIGVRRDESCTYCNGHVGPQARELLRTDQKPVLGITSDPVEASCCGDDPHHLVHNQPSFLSEIFHSPCTHFPMPT